MIFHLSNKGFTHEPLQLQPLGKDRLRSQSGTRQLAAGRRRPECSAKSDIAPSPWSVPTDTFREKGAESIRELVVATQNYGMAVCEVNVELDMVAKDAALRQEGISFFKDAIQAASEAGVQAVKSYTGPIPWNPHALRIPDDISEGEAWASVAEIMSEVMPAAEQHGVEVNIEAVFGHLCHDYYSLSQLFRMVDSPHLGVVMDPSHLYLYDNDIPWAIRQLGEKNTACTRQRCRRAAGFFSAEFCVSSAAR